MVVDAMTQENFGRLIGVSQQAVIEMVAEGTLWAGARPGLGPSWVSPSRGNSDPPHSLVQSYQLS